MPIYEYSCAACDKTFEGLILRKSDEPEVICPVCKGRQVSRLVSRPAAARTGSGPAGNPSCGPVG